MHGEAGVGCLANQLIPGVGQQRGSGVAHQGHGLSAGKAREQVRHALQLVVIVQ